MMEQITLNIPTELHKRLEAVQAAMMKWEKENKTTNFYKDVTIETIILTYIVRQVQHHETIYGLNGE